MAILIEHCAGKFPLWLTPEQIRLLPVSEKYNDFSEELSKVLNNSDIRARIDSRNEKVGKKIREAELEKVPYMLIIGEKEFETGQLSVRRQGEGDLGEYNMEGLKELIQNEIAEMLSAV